MRRFLGAESPPRGYFAHAAILLWCTVTLNCTQPPIKNVQNLKRDGVISLRCLAEASFKPSKMT